jgi:hypothetical protein
MRSVIVLVSLLLASLALGHATYTGYSGAPGSQGVCAGTCHGSSGGTITVDGFPSAYSPGQAYVITVSHNGGSSIENFNASVRVGTGSTNAGTITAGTNTTVYNTGGETNGVHFSSAGQTVGTFTWTAPSPSVGAVKLYLAGHQGSSASGPNTETVLTATGAGIAESGRPIPTAASFRVEPTVTRTTLVLRAGNLLRAATVRIIDREGRSVARVAVSAGADIAVAWPLVDREGMRLPAGVYLALLSNGGTRLARRFVIAGD